MTADAVPVKAATAKAVKISRLSIISSNMDMITERSPKSCFTGGNCLVWVHYIITAEAVQMQYLERTEKNEFCGKKVLTKGCVGSILIKLLAEKMCIRDRTFNPAGVLPLLKITYKAVLL